MKVAEGGGWRIAPLAVERTIKPSGTESRKLGHSHWWHSVREAMAVRVVSALPGNLGDRHHRRKKEHAHADTMAPPKRSTAGVTFRNNGSPYHETGETAALRYILKYLYLARNSRLYLRAHSELHSAAWQLTTFSGARCNDKDILSRAILYINSAYMISGADERTRERSGCLI